MSIPPVCFTATVVDSQFAILALLKDLSGLAAKMSPRMFVQIDRVNLGRHGSISTICILIEGATTIHLIDVARLGALAFDMIGPDGIIENNFRRTDDLKGFL